ncbi:MAG: hypothetical protein O3C34_21420 [Proteobacteria bacterium]|nr:hypothetical protein [Pseudomonadota bacterium]
MKIIPGIIVVCAGLLLGGCFHDQVLPQTSALTTVHRTYETELRSYAAMPIDPLAAEAQTGVSGGKGIQKALATQAPRSNVFAGTLESIRAFRTRFRAQEKELTQAFAHLNGLEGMIYLQSFEFGNAAAVKTRVDEAAKNLTSKTGLAPRDRLLALSYAHLIDGWRETYRFLWLKKPNVDLAAMEKAATGINAVLNKQVSKDNTDPDVDSAGGYLALNEGIFWAWVHQFRAADCKNDNLTKCPAEIEDMVNNRKYYRNAAQSLERFLSKSEVEAVSAAVKTATAENAEADGLILAAKNGTTSEQAKALKKAACLRQQRLPKSSVTGRLELIRWQIWFQEKIANLETRNVQKDFCAPTSG